MQQAVELMDNRAAQCIAVHFYPPQPLSQPHQAFHFDARAVLAQELLQRRELGLGLGLQPQPQRLGSSEFSQGWLPPLIKMGSAGADTERPQPKRMRWTDELHDQFVRCVEKMGGIERATPKGVMRLMGVPGLTMNHCKSHLQKHRTTCKLPSSGGSGSRQARGGGGADDSGSIGGYSSEGGSAVPSGSGTQLLSAGTGTPRSVYACEQQQQQQQQQQQLQLQLLPLWQLKQEPKQELEQQQPQQQQQQQPQQQQQQLQQQQQQPQQQQQQQQLQRPDAAAPGVSLELKEALLTQASLQNKLQALIEMKNQLQTDLQQHGQYLAHLLRGSSVEQAAGQPVAAAAVQHLLHSGSGELRPPPDVPRYRLAAVRHLQQGEQWAG